MKVAIKKSNHAIILVLVLILVMHGAIALALIPVALG